jgi:hypothetical protein
MLCLFSVQGAHAWVYPEHRDITLLAVQKLDPHRRGILERIWADARRNHQLRLTDEVIDAGQGENPSGIDFAAWPAISGDHSCSARNMLHNVLETEWILRVVDIAARLKTRLANASNRSDRINALRSSDFDLLNADPEYITRAGANNVHFLLALPDTIHDLRPYSGACTTEGAELNALGVYAWYHARALAKASLLAREDIPADQRSLVALAALADEAYALHFLQDAFAAGHVAGTWGDASMRKGTHDYYNEHGLPTTTWAGQRTVLVGDAWMRTADAEQAALPVKESLEQLIETASGGPTTSPLTVGQASFPDSLNTCKLETMPAPTTNVATKALCEGVFAYTPVPGFSAGIGELPRFRSELGPFVGITTGGRAGVSRGGFAENESGTGLTAGLEIALRLGVGLEGVMNESGDGLAFLDIGVRQDRASSAKFAAGELAERAAEAVAAVPGRPSLTARLRLPFYVVPLDMLVAAPILFLVSPGTLQDMAIRAANGGLVPWQAGLATSIGRFQFVLGREIGVAFFGYINEKDGLWMPAGETDLSLILLRSIQFDFPILEYRPFHKYALAQSSGLVIQLNTGVDFPQEWEVLASTLPEPVPSPSLKPVWHIGLRIAFDWRYYF